MIKKMYEALAPIKVADKYLCKVSDDLLVVEKIGDVHADKTKNLSTEISKALEDKSEMLVRERNNKNSFTC